MNDGPAGRPDELAAAVHLVARDADVVGRRGPGQRHLVRARRPGEVRRDRRRRLVGDDRRRRRRVRPVEDAADALPDAVDRDDLVGVLRRRSPARCRRSTASPARRPGRRRGTRGSRSRRRCRSRRSTTARPGVSPGVAARPAGVDGAIVSAGRRRDAARRRGVPRGVDREHGVRVRRPVDEQQVRERPALLEGDGDAVAAQLVEHDADVVARGAPAERDLPVARRRGEARAARTAP